MLSSVLRTLTDISHAMRLSSPANQLPVS